MPTVTGLTAARMEEIENQSIVDGSVVGDDLVLTRFDGGTINAGNVRGPQGIQGPVGEVEDVANDNVPYVRRNGLWVAGVQEALSDGKYYQRKDGAWVDSTKFVENAKYAAKGFIEEQNDGTDYSLDTIGEIKYASATHIDVTNNEDHDRNYLLVASARFESDSSGLYRLYSARVSPFDGVGRQMQVEVVGAGASHAVNQMSHGLHIIPAGETRGFETIALKVTGGNGDMIQADLTIYDMGGIPPA